MQKDALRPIPTRWRQSRASYAEGPYPLRGERK